MIDPGHDRGRPGQDAPVVNTTTTAAKSTTLKAEHGAIAAADARPWFNREVYTATVCRMASTGVEFGSDDVAEQHPDLPDLGPGIGGVYMALHRAGVIRRCGYRPSRKPSRAGSVIATWIGPKGVTE